MAERPRDWIAAEMPYPLFAERLQTHPAILGIGACEQHGPELPLATDSIIVESLADSLAAQLPAVRLPTLTYGAPSRPRSGGGDLFPVPALNLPTLYAVVEQLAATTMAAGGHLLVVISWHWENAQILWDAVRSGLEHSPGEALIFDSPADFLPTDLRDQLFPEGFPGWASDHAGRLETAIMRHLTGFVTSSPTPRPPHISEPFDVLPTPRESVPTDGVFYDPGTPSDELGGACLQAISSGLIGAVRGRMRRSS